MERIRDDVHRELRRFGVPGGMPELLDAWSQTVGLVILRNAWPARLARDNTLHVATSSATWAFELTQLAPQMLERLRARLGDQAPSALRFAPGHVPEPAGETETRPAARVAEPGPQDAAEAASLALGIDDARLRETVERAVALALSQARSGRSVW